MHSMPQISTGTERARTRMPRPSGYRNFLLGVTFQAANQETKMAIMVPAKAPRKVISIVSSTRYRMPGCRA